MKCPFAYEVGDPPSVVRCPRGFPGCACGDEMVAHLLDGTTTEQTTRIVEWWRENGDEF